MDTESSAILAARAPALLKHFGLRADSLTPLPSWNNPIVRVESPEGTFALRWHRQKNRTETHIRGELALLRELRRSRLPVPQPLLTEAGDMVLAEGEQLYDLTGWLLGRVRRSDLKTEDAHSLGLTLAELHMASRTLNLAYALPHYLEPFSVKGTVNLSVLTPYFSAKDLNLIRTTERQASGVFTECVRQPDSIGVIHNDSILGNCLWQESRVSVLDFADCGIGLYLYDLAPMLTNFDAPNLQNAFVEGYTSARPLSKTERELLPLMQAVRHVRACLSSITKAQWGDPGPPLAEHLTSRMMDIRTLTG